MLSKEEVLLRRQEIFQQAELVRKQIASWPSWMPRTLGPVPTAPTFPSKMVKR